MHTIASLMIRFGVYGLPANLGRTQTVLNELGCPAFAQRRMPPPPSRDENKVWI